MALDRVHLEALSLAHAASASLLDVKTPRRTLYDVRPVSVVPFWTVAGRSIFFANCAAIQVAAAFVGHFECSMTKIRFAATKTTVHGAC